jgi:hypothetical protein
MKSMIDFFTSIQILGYRASPFLLLVIVATGCGRNTSGTNRKGPIIDPIHSRELEVTQKETVTFLRQEQMINRYDCKGNLTSRKFETMNSLSKKITINYEHRKKAWNYTVYNRRTKSSQKGAFTTDGKFITDYAPTVFNMRVKKGLNEVEYAFYRCPNITLDAQGEKICSGSLELEKEGMVLLDVYYTAETIPGEQHIRPTPDNCRSQK